jgi:hypothetical protein
MLRSLGSPRRNHAAEPRARTQIGSTRFRSMLDAVQTVMILPRHQASHWSQNRLRCNNSAENRSASPEQPQRNEKNDDRTRARIMRHSSIAPPPPRHLASLYESPTIRWEFEPTGFRLTLLRPATLIFIRRCFRSWICASSPHLRLAVPTGAPFSIGDAIAG